MKTLRQRDPTFLFRKKHGTRFGVAGDPDLYGAWHGVPWAIELKRPGEQPTQLQTLRLAEWSAAGAYTGVIHSMPEFHRWLGEFPLISYLKE
jgi:hypothetical protein